MYEHLVERALSARLPLTLGWRHDPEVPWGGRVEIGVKALARHAIAELTERNSFDEFVISLFSLLRDTLNVALVGKLCQLTSLLTDVSHSEVLAGVFQEYVPLA